MSIAEQSASLLRTIARIVGADVGTFVALRDADDGSARDRNGPLLLLRLVKSFRSLPTDESRVQALLILEAFAARINETAPAPPPDEQA